MSPESLPRLTSEVREFMVEAKQHGYGSQWGNEHKVILPDGRYQIDYTAGDMKYVDTWSGGNPFKGAEDICWQTEEGVWRPIWGLTYAGEVPDYLEPDEARAAVNALQFALTHPDPVFPARGGQHSIDKLHYHHGPAGLDGLERFDFRETVRNERGLHYYAGYIVGTLVNRSATLETSGQTPWFAPAKD